MAIGTYQKNSCKSALSQGFAQALIHLGPGGQTEPAQCRLITQSRQSWAYSTGCSRLSWAQGSRTSQPRPYRRARVPTATSRSRSSDQPERVMRSFV